MVDNTSAGVVIKFERNQKCFEHQLLLPSINSVHIPWDKYSHLVLKRREWSGWDGNRFIACPFSSGSVYFRCNAAEKTDTVFWIVALKASFYNLLLLDQLL